MKTYSKDINIYCDIKKDWRCFGESSVTLTWWQGKKIAYKQFRKEGWKVGIIDICPYCINNNKILNNNHEKNLFKSL